MTKIRNNYQGTVNVAGVDIRPGATVFVTDKQFDAWRRGATAKNWVDQKIISVLDDEASASEGDESGFLGDNKPKDEKTRLLERARELGLNPNANTGVPKLEKMIAEAEAAKE